MMEKFQYICNELKNEEEFAIIREYGNDSKRFTFIISRKIFTNICYKIQNKLNFDNIKYKIQYKQIVNQITQYIFHCNFCNKDDII